MSKELLKERVVFSLVRSETLPGKESLSDLEWIPTTWDNVHLLNIYGFREFKGNWQPALVYYTVIDLETLTTALHIAEEILVRVKDK